MKAIRVAAAVAVVGMACSFASAEVKLASVFTDHMVLQRDKAVRVWGTAEAGKKVTVKVGDHEASATAGSDGKWAVRLGETKASETPVEMVVREEGGNTVKVEDVLFGDVWVCSGQSNMEFALSRASNAEQAVAGATDEKVRLLTVPHKVSDQPLAEQGGKWVVCSPETVKGFTAVGYFFGKEIRKDEHVPVGLVGTYWGGTLAEAWTPGEYLKAEEWLPLWERDQKQIAEYPKAKEAYDARVKAWEAKPAASRGRKPVEPRGKDSQHRPAVLWNGMVQPLVPMSITGVIWYQGESNAGRAEQYRTLFPNLIVGWRNEFEQGEVPFLFVQLANYGKSGGDSPAGSAWAELREAQAMTLKKLPNTGMAVTIDVGNPTNIHPTDKETVGKRLALAAEHVAYGHKDVAYEGPTYKAMEVEGDGKVRVTFDHAQGLTAKGGAVEGFAVAGEDKKFVPAEAAIDGDAVVVAAPAGVGKVAAVRYGWAGDPKVNLYNGAGLPAVPFRTDGWAGATAGKR